MFIKVPNTFVTHFEHLAYVDKHWRWVLFYECLYNKIFLCYKTFLLHWSLVHNRLNVHISSWVCLTDVHSASAYVNTRTFMDHRSPNTSLASCRFMLEERRKDESSGLSNFLADFLNVWHVLAKTVRCDSSIKENDSFTTLYKAKLRRFRNWKSSKILKII